MGPGSVIHNSTQLAVRPAKRKGGAPVYRRAGRRRGTPSAQHRSVDVRRKRLSAPPLHGRSDHQFVHRVPRPEVQGQAEPARAAEIGDSYTSPSHEVAGLPSIRLPSWPTLSVGWLPFWVSSETDRTLAERSYLDVRGLAVSSTLTVNLARRDFRPATEPRRPGTGDERASQQ